MLDELNGDYESTSVWKTHSDKKRTPEFVVEIQSMIENDLSKSIRSIAREVVQPWVKRVAAGKAYVWQQDSASCHTNRRTQSWLSDKRGRY